MRITVLTLLTVACFSLCGCYDTFNRADSTETSAREVVKPEGEPSRSFHIRYAAEAEELPVGKVLRLWIPLPSDDPHQTIRNLEIDAPLKHTIETEPVYGNRMAYFEGEISEPNLKIDVEYDVDRYPYRTDHAKFERDGAGGVSSVHLRPSTLCVVNDEVRTMAANLAEGQKGTLGKARAFYEHVSGEMTYGKPDNLPWGRGDTLYACDARVGNCTDFHSYFISLCLAENIPARFQIGLFGNYEKKPGEEYKTGGYHCWAEFHVPGHGWVPVDISEADKDPKADYFGYHTDNRVTLTTGRDLTLSPKQGGSPLNYFVHPYAEVDGKPFAGVKKQGYWRDIR
jgi:transglutaminase-like putative cysteine protease